MPQNNLRKDLSTLGWFLIMMLLLVNGVAIFAMFVVTLVSEIGPSFGLSVQASKELKGLLSNTLFLMTISAIAQYAIGMPIAGLGIKSKIPCKAARSYLAPINALPREQDIAFREEAGESRYRMSDAISIIPIGIFLGALGSVIGAFLSDVFGGMFGIEVSNSQVDELLSGGLWVTMLFVVILAPIAEELFFRKLLLDSLAPYSRRGAVIVAAMAFSFFHQNLYQIFYAFFLGAVFGVVYLKTRNILHTIALHMWTNFFGGVVTSWALEGVSDKQLEALDPSNAEATAELMSTHPMSVLFLAFYGALVVAGFFVLIYWIISRKFYLAERREAPTLGNFMGAVFTAPGQIAFILLCVGVSIFNLFQI